MSEFSPQMASCKLCGKHFDLNIYSAACPHGMVNNRPHAETAQRIRDGGNKYQQQASKTAIYEDTIRAFVEKSIEDGNIDHIVEALAMCYSALGLASEAGEVAGKIKKMIRDDGCIMTGERVRAIREELGGVRWYTADMATRMEEDLGEIDLRNLEILNSRKQRGKIQGDGDNR